MKKLHAIHNEDACNFLLSSQKFNDWVVTTAFYSALHFVQHEIFPLDHSGVTYTEFNKYFLDVLKKKKWTSNKHKATIQLVTEKIPAAAPYYRWLYDTCMNARYSNYKVSAAKAQMAKAYLGNLKQHLAK
jgi:hypothetical protein